MRKLSLHWYTFNLCYSVMALRCVVVTCACHAMPCRAGLPHPRLAALPRPRWRADPPRPERNLDIV